jgi:hypothetical protein
MTTSFWDRDQIQKQFPECATFRELITRIETEISTKGEVICEIRVNGRILSEEDESLLANNPSREIQEITIRTNRPADLIKEALASAVEFLPEVEAASVAAAEGFRGADLNAAQKAFGDAIEGCQWLIDTLMHIRGAASGIGQPIAQPERWYEAEKIISKAVSEVSDAYAANDMVLVADLMEYEVTGALGIWREALESERTHRA